MRYLPMNKKGVSPIIATLLLIVIAVAAAVVTYAFVTGFIGTSGGSAQQVGQMSYDIREINSTGAVNLVVRNSGTKTLILGTGAAFYVNNVAVAPTSISDTSLTPGETSTIIWMGPYTDGTAIPVKVVAADGTPLEVMVS